MGSAVSAATAHTLSVRLSGIYVDVPAGTDPVAGVDVGSGDYCVTDIYPPHTSAGQGVDPIGKFYYPMSGAVTLMAYDFNDGGQIALDVGRAPTWPFAWVRYPGKPPTYSGGSGGTTQIGSTTPMPVIAATGSMAYLAGGQDMMSYKTWIGDAPGPCMGMTVVEDCVCHFTNK